jgi:putative DNA primase/helicase
VAAASKYLYALFDTFPFVSDADASALLAMAMTALLRRVLPAAPIGCISASTPGTGKSLLADCISMLATGRTAAVAAIGKDAEELEKRVDSLLLKGDSLCSFDNIDRAVKSDVLCQVTTQGTKSVRVLGLSRIVEAPTNLTLLMTGNNLTLLGDLVRRTVLCNLDAGLERPELREFERNAVAHVRERRGQGVRAALTIAKGYLDAGCPRVTDGQGRRVAPFGSFEIWDKMIRLPLMWAGWPDPLQAAESMREQDHEFAGMVDFLAALLEASQGKPMTIAEIADLMKERRSYEFGTEGPKYPALHEAAEAAFGPSQQWEGQKLGYRFRYWKQRILGGLRLVEAVEKGRRNGRYWRVERVNRS